MTRPGGRPISDLGLWRAAALVAASACAVYSQTLWHGLLWDDPLLLEHVANAYRRGGLGEVLTTDFRLHPREPLGYYRPVVLLSLLIDGRLSGGAPWLFHLTNVSLHALNAVLVFFLARALAGVGFAALAGGSLFAVHPVHVESVAFVSGRTDLLACTFVLGSVLLWLRHRQLPEATRTPAALAAAALFVLGALSKELALLLPGVLAAWDLALPHAKSAGGWWQRNRCWILAFAIGAGCVIGLRLTVANLDPSWVPGGGTLRVTPVEATTTGQVASRLGWYLRLLAIPWPLNAYYTSSQLVWTVATLLGALVAAGLFAVTGRRDTGRVGLMGATWTMLFLVPVLGVVPIRGAALAERFLYVPSVGLCLAGGVAAVWLATRLRPRGLVHAAGVALVSLLALATVTRAAVWKDPVRFFDGLVRSSPHSAMPLVELGQAYADQERYEESRTVLEKAVRLDPASAGAFDGLGVAYARADRYGEALAAFTRALQLEPDRASAHFNLAILHVQMGEWQRASERRAILGRIDSGLAARLDEILRRAAAQSRQ